MEHPPTTERDIAIPGLDELRGTLMSNEPRTRAFLTKLDYLPTIDAWLALLLDCHALALDHVYADGAMLPHSAQRDLMEAYAGISHVAIVNAESALLCLLRGLYGTSASIVRSLTLANNLVADVCNTPDASAAWLRLGTYKSNSKRKEAITLRAYFQDSEVRKRVAGMRRSGVAKTLQPLLNQYVHATPFGSEMFFSEDPRNPGSRHLRYEAQYIPHRALLCAHLMALSLP